MEDKMIIDKLRYLSSTLESDEDSAVLNRAIQAIEDINEIKSIIEQHDNDSCPEDYWYIDKIREQLKSK